MAVKLHHCSLTFMKVPGHPCAEVRKALDAAGIPYEIVTHPLLPRSRRTELERLTGQRLLPALELEDGTVVREESKEMIARIRSGQLPGAR